jgi:hypothetical protein
VGFLSCFATFLFNKREARRPRPNKVAQCPSAEEHTSLARQISACFIGLFWKEAGNVLENKFPSIFLILIFMANFKTV